MAKTDSRPYYGRRLPRLMNNGYVRVYEPSHPLANRDGYVLEHRKVVHDAGIEVPPGCHVHHVNHDKTDNRIENLEVVPAGDHGRQHAVEAGFVTNQFGTFPLRPPRTGHRLIGDEVRLCAECGVQIPSDRRAHAKYCSDECGNRLRMRRFKAKRAGVRVGSVVVQTVTCLAGYRTVRED